MSECPFQSRLSAFHDHELDAETAEKLESHLAGCPTCNEQLLGIRAVSRLFREAPSGRMSQIGLSRLHVVADTAAKRRDVFPMFRVLLAVAASILVIAGSWLIETPDQIQTLDTTVVKLKEMAPWEKLASGGKLDAPQGLNRDTGVASRFSDWMIENLKRNSGDRSERKSGS